MTALPCIVASVRPWNRELPERLAARTGRDFVFVASPEELETALRNMPEVAWVFVAHWSARIPESVWSKHETVIFHMTNVPYGRGGSPLQNLIVRGYHDTVVSAIRCVAEMDAGPVYLRRPLWLFGTAEEVFIRADRVIEDMIAEIVARRPEPVPQEGEPVIFTRRRPEDGRLSGEMTLDEVYDHIRMLDGEGYPPAYLDAGGLRFEFSRATKRVGRLEASVTIRPAPGTPRR